MQLTLAAEGRLKLGYILTKEAFDKALKKLAEKRLIYAPVLKVGEGRFTDTDVVRYDYVTELSQIELSKKSDYAFKEILTPLSETLFFFTENEVKTADRDPREVIVFLKSCDMHAVRRLDQIYLNNGIEQDYDAHYKSFNMNEVRYGFCQRDLISSWGSVDTGRNPYEAITYLKSWANYRLSWMQASLLLPFSGVSLKADKTMIAKGESITLTATPFPSCTTDLSYSFTCFDDSDIYEICETTDRTVTTEPNKVGTFRYRVSAKGANTNRYDSDFITVTVLKKEAASPPTCTSDGNIEYYVDNSNNKYYVRKNGSFKEIDIKDIIVSSSGHSYTEETIQPDCTNQGYTLHTCSKCSDSYKDTYTNALGHTFSEEVIPPTTTAQGYTLHTCTVCTYSYMDNYTDKLAEPLVNTTSLSKESIRMGGSITVCGSATGGVSPYEYVFYYKKSTDTYYKTLKALDSETTAVFEPTSAGTYNFRTKVKDQAGKMTVKDLTLTVTSDLSNTSYLSESSAVLGGSVTIYGAASGGSGP